MSEPKLMGALEIQLRKAEAEDLQAILELFELSVREGSKEEYTADQRQVWVAGAKNTRRWKRAIREQCFILAFVEGILVGFGSTSKEGYVDFMYVHPKHMGKGVARALYEVMEGEMLGKGVREFTTHSSHTARKFFERMGFGVVEENSMVRDGVSLSNWLMKKTVKR